MEPEQGRAIAVADDDAADEVTLRDEEGGAEVAVAEQQDQSGEEHRECEQDE
jgi:hypothetical protein